jgi:flagellar hook-associated protein 3 FlgL
MAILPLQLARVSNLLRTNVATSTLARTQHELLKTENELSTGRRLNSPSDDPGAAAIAQQLRKTLEKRLAYSDNLREAQSQLGEVDSTLGDLTALLEEAQSIASANVGSDVTPEARASAAAIVQSLYSQALSLGNKQFKGAFLFAGVRATHAPFAEEGGGVKFVGSTELLANTYDENTTLPFQVDGGEVFGALSSRVTGTADLSPSMSGATRLADLRGALDKGIRLGSIQVSDGTTSGVVDLTGSDTVDDVINKINAAGVGAVTAVVAPDGVSVLISAGAGDNISVNEVGGGTTAADLGILNVSGSGVGVPLDGAALGPKVTRLTPIASLRAGAGINSAGIRITNGQLSATVDLTGVTTVEDLLNRINGSNTNVRAQINSTGTGIDILNPSQGTPLTIGENGGTTATDLGVRSFGPASPLAELNDGKGVRTVDGSDVRITDSGGTAFEVDLSDLSTVQDVIDAINTAAGAASAGVTASFATSGNGIVLTDTASGAGTLTLSALNFSNAAADLGLTGAASAGVISGTDVNAVSSHGIFANLSALRDALKSNDQKAITAAGEGLKQDYDRVVQVRGETGARVQELDARSERLEDQNIATRGLLSSIEDTDYTSAIAKFQTLQTALQANLATAGRVMNLSLLDFLS